MFNNAEKVIGALNRQYGKSFVDEAVQEVFQGKAPGRISSSKEKELKLVANMKKVEAQKAKLVAQQALQEKEAYEAERLAQRQEQQWMARQRAQQLELQWNRELAARCQPQEKGWSTAAKVTAAVGTLGLLAAGGGAAYYYFPQIQGAISWVISGTGTKAAAFAAYVCEKLPDGWCGNGEKP